MKRKPSPRRETEDGYLSGQLLIAMPSMRDARFARSVIYMCAHSAECAMGLIINQRASHISFPHLLSQLGILGDDAEEAAPPQLLGRDVHIGGPVERGRGFVLHSDDYFATASTLRIDGGVCLTATMDILKAIAAGKGPHRSILALGYAGWGPGQLESEIHGNGWLNCPADRDLVFGLDLENKYDRALAKLGIDPTFLVSEAGHA